MKSIYLYAMLLGFIFYGSINARAEVFTENSPEGIALNFTILNTEADATPAVEISGFATAPTKQVPSLTLPGVITHEGTAYDVTAVGEKAFHYKVIDNLTLGEGITEIKGYAFSGSGLVSVKLPSTLKSLGQGCLSNNRFTQIFIPKSVTKINSFALDSDSLQYIEVESGNENYASEDGILYNSGFTSLIFCPMSHKAKIRFPNTVISIEKQAFESVKYIKTLTLPSSVTHVGDRAFAHSQVETVKIPDSANASFANGVFYNCEMLKEIYIGTAVKNLGHGAVTDCWNLEKVIISPDNAKYTTDGIGIYNKEQTELYCILDSYEGDYTLPSTVTTMPYQSGWGYAKKINRLTIPTSVKNIGYNVFVNGTIIFENPNVNDIQLGDGALSSATSIIVPIESLDAYKNAWPEYENKIFTDEYEMSVAVNEPLSTKKTIRIPVSLKNPENIIGFQCDIHLPYSASIARDSNNKFDIKLSDRASKTHIVSSGVVTDGSEISGTSTVVRVVCISMRNAEIKGNDGVLFEIPVTLSRCDPYYKNSAVFAIDNIHLSKTGSIRVDLPKVKKLLREIDYMPGDADDDGAVSIVDVTSTVAYMTGQKPEKFVLEAVDFDKDEVIMINDVTSLINMVLDDEDTSAAPSSPRRTVSESAETTSDSMSVAEVTAMEDSQSEVRVSMTTQKPILGFQCDITLPEGITVNQSDDEYIFALNPERAVDHMVASKKLTNKANTYRIVVVSLTNSLIKGNSGEMFSFPVTVKAPKGVYDITLSKIILSAENNHRVDVPQCTGTFTVTSSSGISDINADETAEDVRYYDLMGRPATPQSRGVMVSKHGKKLIK